MLNEVYVYVVESIELSVPIFPALYEICITQQTFSILSFICKFNNVQVSKSVWWMQKERRNWELPLIKIYRRLRGSFNFGEFIYLAPRREKKSDSLQAELKMVNGTMHWTEILVISSIKESRLRSLPLGRKIFLMRRQIISKVYQRLFSILWSWKRSITRYSEVLNTVVDEMGKFQNVFPKGTDRHRHRRMQEKRIRALFRHNNGILREILNVNDYKVRVRCSFMHNV